jgi:acetyl esterase/lipase
MMSRATRWPLAVLLLAWAGAVHAQAPAKQIPLYPGAAPGSEKWDWKERAVKNKAGQPMVTDVVRPVLLHYPAEKGKAVGTAMVVAPGGGFRVLMMSYEGEDVARRLNALGVDAFVLKYRLIHNGPGAPPAQDVIKMAGDDGRQAIRLVRERAGAFGVRPDRVGMIGYSAGGLVTADALFGPQASRPNFAALIYGAREANDVPSPAPPLFLAVAADDALAVGRTVELFTAYRKARGPAELHVFQTGGHGFGKKGGGADHYLDRLEEWLAVNGLLTKAGARSPAPPGPGGPPRRRRGEENRGAGREGHPALPRRGPRLGGLDAEEVQYRSQ